MEPARLVLQRRDFLAGLPATEGTIRWMGTVVREAAVDARIRQRARQITAVVRSFDHAAEIAAVYQFILDHVRYVRDPDGVEYMTHPVELDRQVDEGTAAEDCEGMVLYGLSLLASIGIPGLIVAHGFDRRAPTRFAHCAAIVLNPRTRRATWFDPVGALEWPGFFWLGDTVYRPGDPLAAWDLDGRKVTMDDIRSLFGRSEDRSPSLRAVALGDPDYGAIARGIADEVKKAAPAFGPYGALAAGLIQVGESVYDAVTGERVGQAIGEPVRVPPPPAGTGTVIVKPGTRPVSAPISPRFRAPTGLDLRRPSAVKPDAIDKTDDGGGVKALATLALVGAAAKALL